MFTLVGTGAVGWTQAARARSRSRPPPGATGAVAVWQGKEARPERVGEGDALAFAGQRLLKIDPMPRRARIFCDKLVGVAHQHEELPGRERGPDRKKRS